MAPIGTNPFDDDDNVATVHVPSSTNNGPFDDGPIPVIHSSPTTEDDEHEDPAGAADDLPVEASWQYLGDLPYRRVPVYEHVRWQPCPVRTSDKSAEDMNYQQVGLASFPARQGSAPGGGLLDARDQQDWYHTSTQTLVTACPHGGPIAAMTVPVGGMQRPWPTTQLRLMTNSGQGLATWEMPPPNTDNNNVKYTAADILTMGFTDRSLLIVVLRDSLTLVHDMQGNAVLPPFHVLPQNSSKRVLLKQATVYEGGVAVVSSQNQAALCELLDADHDDQSYANGAHLGSRRIQSIGGGGGGGNDSPKHPPHYALVTPLPTQSFARENGISFVTIAVLPRFHTTSRHPEVFLSTSDNSVVICNSATTEMTDVNCRKRITSPICQMSFAPNGRFLACFTQHSILTVISTSFETKVLDFDTSEGSKAPPQDMQWCGEDSVVLRWKQLGVLMVGPYGDWLRFPFEQTQQLCLVPELDSCRIVTDHSVEVLQRVPPETAALLRIGSIEPSAMLLDASDAFYDGASPSSDEAARAIGKTGMLKDAIETCIEAALKEWDVAMQKRLLRAASFGMHVSYKDPVDGGTVMGGPATGASLTESTNAETMPSETAIKFVTAGRQLRILNSLRDPAVGMLLSSAQLDHITMTGLIARLVALKRPALATSISQYLHLPPHVQLYARAAKAAAFVADDTSHSDSETAEAAIRIITEEGRKSSSSAAGAFASVALAANQAGRPGVANLLLLLENSVADKVPALMATGSFVDAMAVATTARDADFIFQTLMEYEQACIRQASDLAAAQQTFYSTATRKFTTEGFNTLRNYLETLPSEKSVVNLLLRAHRFQAAGCSMAARALKQTDRTEQMKMLAEASRLYGLGKDTGFHKSCTDEQIELLKDQDVLRNKYGVDEVAPAAKSVTETIVSVIHHAARNKRESHRLLSDADKIGKKFRIPEKRMWYVKVKAFSDSEQWTQLRTLADSKTKSPIGYRPFAMACIKGKQPSSEIVRYIDRVPAPEERYDLFCEAGLHKRALDEAVKLRDPDRIQNVRSMATSADIQRQCEEMYTRLVSG